MPPSSKFQSFKRLQYCILKPQPNLQAPSFEMLSFVALSSALTEKVLRVNNETGTEFQTTDREANHV